MIVGYEPSSSSPFSSLLLAAYRSDQLEYVGSVGTGFKARQASDLRSLMDRVPWKRKEPPVPYEDKRNVVWIAPTLIAEIEYRAWTTNRQLRHASFKGL
ncbi:ATP dependent DNA ligase [Rhizobium sp. CFBP 13726]|uniref:ATP dependent DNA ligase n=1 Tax=Rhizobium sp. CFBP 13726 TaxID=2775296 RepID=UPI00406CB116